MDNNEMHIGERIKSARNNKRMTQRELSDLTDINTSVISSYENSLKIPGLQSLAKIASVLDVSIDYLYYGAENEKEINMSKDDAAIIVNCICKLYELGIIGDVRDVINATQSNAVLYGLYYKKFPASLRRLMDSLDEFNGTKKTFQFPDKYLNMVKESVANEIRNEMARYFKKT